MSTPMSMMSSAYTHAQQSNDEKLLAALGYKQEFKRHFSMLELFGIGFSLISVVPGISTVVVYSIGNGGPSAMVWGWATCSFFLMFIAMALAELGSAAPTSGGLYYWTWKFSSQRYRNLLAWIVGYSNSLSYIAGVAATDWGLAVQITAAASIGSNMAYVPTIGQTYGVFCAILCSHVIVASLATKIVARLQVVYIAVYVLLCIGLIIALPAATPSELKNSAGFVFGSFENLTTWPSGYAFILSFLAPLWVVCGFDSAVHISEEAQNANTAVPWAIILSVGAGSLLGWAFNVVLAFNMGTDLASILESPTGQPVAAIFYNSFGLKGALAAWSFVIIGMYMSGSSILIACSRQMFAFSRDSGFPFSRLLYRINSFTGTPVNCVIISAFFAGLIGLLAFAGEAATGAVFTLGVVGQYISYSAPIAARWLGGAEFKPGPFSLGIFSLPVSLTALSWMTFMIIVLLFPTLPDPPAPDMNYTVVVAGGVILLSIIYFYFPRVGGVYWFRGPLTNVNLDEEGEAEVGEGEGKHGEGHARMKSVSESSDGDMDEKAPL